jgi:hypothetical protein
VPANGVVAKSAAHIAGMAGFTVAAECPMLLVEETGTGPEHPFSGEKLSVVLEGAGSMRNGLPFTLSLSCGTWGANITAENVNARHFVNMTWVSRPIEPKVISEEALFAAHWQAHGR